MKRRAANAAFAVLALAAGPAWAGEEAQSLFDRGVELMEAGRFSEACPLLAESQRIEAAGGTVLNLAFCLERTGKLIEATASYAEAERIARSDGRSDREVQAAARRKRAESRVPQVRLRFPLTEGLEVRLDGEPVVLRGAVFQGRVNPGSHVVEARTSPTARTRRPFSAAEGETVDLVFAEAEFARPAESDRATPPRSLPPPPHASSSQRTVALGVGLGGTVLTIAGVAFGVAAAGRHADSEALCPGGTCAPGGLEAERQADTLAWGANVGIGVGIVALGVAAALWLTAPRRPTTTSSLHVRF